MTRVFGLSIILCLLISAAGQAQNRYMVFFTDKANSPFSLDKPADFLSQRSIERRSKQSIALNETDLPVQENYVSSLADMGIEVFYRTKWMNGVLVQAMESDLPSITALPFVESVEFVAPDAPLRSDGPDADGLGSTQMMHARSDFQNEMLGIDAMHRDGYRGEGVLIGVFDEGFAHLSQLSAFDHLFADDRILYTHDFTTNRTNVENAITHGRRVLSVLATKAEGSFLGTAPEASYILSITEAPGEYRIEEYNWLFAAEKADSAGVDLINTSLGYNLFQDPAMDYTLAEMDGQTAVITRAANLAASKGIALVTSAGNTGLSLEWPIITAPGDSPAILAVGAVNSVPERARLSSGGPSSDGRIKPDVAALGIATAVIGSTGQVTFSDGTSFASPLVAGLAAGLWQANPDLTAEQLLDLIRLSGSRYQNPDNEIGYGIPDYVTAMRIADEIGLPAAERVTAYPNPMTGGIVTLAFDTGFFDQAVSVLAFNARGQRIDSFSFTPSSRDNRIQLDLNGQPAGIYLLRITGTSGVETKRVIKY